jgi:TonB family protein
VRFGRFRLDIFVDALVLSALVHVTWIIPGLFTSPPQETRVEVILDPDSPPLPPVAEPEKPKDKKKKKEQEKLAQAPEPAEIEVKLPEKVIPPPPTVPVQPPPPPPAMPKNAISVDQDQFAEEEDNPDAKYLSQKNHRTAEDTRAKNTNLLRAVESKVEATSSQNENKDQDPGHKDDKIAELQDRAGNEKILPRGGPKPGAEGKSPDDKQKPGALSMRDLTPRSQVEAKPAERKREGVEMQETGAGDLPMARIGRDQDRSRSAPQGTKLKLNLNHHDYDAIEGFAAADQQRREAARAESSHKKGRYERYLAKAAAMRSSIENFVDVKLGNQQELGTRKSPFAGYITAVHRQIHKLFAFGFLTDIESKFDSKGPYSDQSLSATLEIVIKSDGSVDKVGIVRTSGVMGFDVAAIDSVMSSAPFPSPPKEIRSTNGKTYLHWRFNRNEEACTTAGVQPFILNAGEEPPRDNITDDKKLYERAREHREEPRALKREKTEEPQVVVQPHEHHETLEVPEVTAEARAVVEGWFADYARGNVPWLAGRSATPFSAGGQTIARNADALKKIYRQLLDEASGDRKAVGVEVLTPAGIRGKLGALPPGGEENGMLYAVGKVGREEFILLLKKSNQGWRVCGIDR